VADDPNAAGTTSGANASVDQAATAATATATTTTPVVTGDTTVAAATETPPAWRGDWREALAGDNAAFLTQLKRFASPENVGKSFWEKDTMIRSGQYRQTLPDAPTEDEIAAYRTQHGIPQTPDEYALAWPETFKPSDNDTATLAEFRQAMHGVHAPPAIVKAAFDFWSAGTERAAQAQHDRLRNAEIETRAALRKEYGRDFDRFVGADGGPSLANEFLAEFAGADGPAMMGWKLADGTTLGSHPEFVRFAVRGGLATASADRIVASETQTGGKSLDDQYKEMITVNGSMKPEDKAKAKDPAFQAQLTKLAEMRVQRDERAGGRRAA
jgi:hypothetical protein